MRFLPALIVTLASFSAATQSAVSAEAKPADRATSGGLSVFALITDDADWMQKWQSSFGVAPQFHPAEILHVGEKGQVLTMFTGATGKNGEAELSCEVTLTEGDGKVTAFPAQICYRGALSGGSKAVYMTQLDMGYAVAPTDPDGLVTFEIAVTDVNAKSRAVVEVSVVVKTGVAGT